MRIDTCSGQLTLASRQTRAIVLASKVRLNPRPCQRRNGYAHHWFITQPPLLAVAQKRYHRRCLEGDTVKAAAKFGDYRSIRIGQCVVAEDRLCSLKESLVTKPIQYSWVCETLPRAPDC